MSFPKRIKLDLPTASSTAKELPPESITAGKRSGVTPKLQNKRHRKSQLDENKIMQASDANYPLHPILPDELTADTPLIEVYVDSVVTPKDLSKIVVQLNSVLPLPELCHLKRVKSRCVLLFPKSLCPVEDVQKFLREKQFDIAYLKNEVRSVSVAGTASKTRRQYDVVNQLWPCNFHSDKYLEALVNNKLFNDKELENHLNFMKLAIEVAEFSRDSYSATSKSGVVIVDPKINSVVAVGYSQASDNPCKHACMVAIDNVAATQNGGAWEKRPLVVENDFNLSGIPEDMLKFLKKKSCVAFGSTLFREKGELERPEDGPYLCTDYYVYATHEPCVMCSMGFVHSRAKRVFFGCRSSNGGLATLCKLHTVRDLNHHYEVFGGLLEAECANL